MRRQVEPSLLDQVQGAHNAAAQLAALRTVKNLLIGHELRKVEWIGYGILPLISELLSAKKRRNGKQIGLGSKIPRNSAEKRQAVDEEEAVFLQATGIVCIIAKGGTAFVEPILHSDILPHLLSALSADTCSVRTAHGILRCLNAVADHLPPSAPTHWLPNQQLAQLLYSSEHVACWARIISQTGASAISQQVCALAAGLIYKTCTETRHQRSLAQTAILPALATRLAAHVVAQGFAMPWQDLILTDSTGPMEMPTPAPASARLAPILAALALLLDGARDRSEEFLSSTPIMAVFPKLPNEKPSTAKKTPWTGYPTTPWNLSPLPRFQNPIDSFLPLLPYVSQNKSPDQTNFPPLGSTALAQRREPSFLPIDNPDDKAKDSDDALESPLIAWLVLLTRTETGLSRIMAAKLLVILFKQGLTKKSRISDCCKIVVPALVEYLGKDMEFKQSNPTTDAIDAGFHPYILLEQPPAILAELIIDDPDLQKATVDARAIKPLCTALKETFDFTAETQVAMWWPDRDARLAQVKGVPVRKIGVTGPSDRFRHTMRHRESLLKALAALAPFSDEYRKAICEQGVLPMIIDSLKPMVLTATSAVGESSYFYPSSGNPAATLLAACSAVRALSRSVSALRTNLIDAGVAAPVLKLLKNPDPEIRIAATKVVGNLAMDFSPMKEAVGHSNVIKTLCEHAHSANPRLRFESIWALKQLVVNSTNSLKKSVIQELGPSWMKQLISTDPSEIPPGVVIGLIDLDFPNRRHIYPSGDDVEMGDFNDPYPDFNISNQYTVPEDDPNRHTVEDDTAIQEQLLDLVRNLFCGEKASEIIEYIFAEIGQKDFFDILLARLKPRIVPGHTRKENKSIQPPAGIILKVLYIIVHIAASLSKFRNLLSSNQNLMRQVLAYTTHTNRDIRVQCCWVAINLTYEDDPSDHAACRHRAADLQRVGYFAKLLAMDGDVDLDVRERQKTACQIIRKFIS